MARATSEQANNSGAEYGTSSSQRANRTSSSWWSWTALALSVVALTLSGVSAGYLFVEVPRLYATQSGPSPTVLYSSNISSTSGNATVGYSGFGNFSFPSGNPRPGILNVTLVEMVGAAIVIELAFCDKGFGICTFPGGSLDIIPTSPLVAETQELTMAPGDYVVELFELPDYNDGRPVVSFSVQITITLDGQLTLG